MEPPSDDPPSYDPPSYEEARLTAGCANRTSPAVAYDILHFLEITREQTSHLDRVKGMFTATEAIFWMIASQPRDTDVLRQISPVLGTISQYAYLYLQVYKVAPHEEELDARIHLQLLHFFDKWESLILHHRYLYTMSIGTPPLRYITYNRATYASIIRTTRDLGFSSLELGLDRGFTTLLYGGSGARAGFPQPPERNCRHREGQRRRQIRQLLNNAEIQAPDRPNLMPSRRGWCPDCDLSHRR